MKTIIRNLFFLVAVLSFLGLSTGCKNEASAFGVNDVVSDPGAFSGSLTLVGIVNAYSQSDPTIVAVMDKKELTCNTPNCEKVLLPVKITGARPAIGDEVRISGSFTTESWGKLFNASKMEVLGTHNLGGQG